MIIFNKRKPVDCVSGECVGTTGDNLAYTQEFYIKGIRDETISYTLHLRFCDGSVNSVTPSLVSLDENGTLIRWVVTKNDIFTHGSFELQIEGTNSFGLVFQTEIVRLYADESLPVEDKEYQNPNSETLKLREEAYQALSRLEAQQKELDENIAKIDLTSLEQKADKADTYTKAETDEAVESYVSKNCYTSDEADSTFQVKLREGNNVSISTDAIISVDLSGKYDASNVETGSGELTVYSENMPIPSAKFAYQRTGDFVTLALSIELAEATMGVTKSYQLLGLPYKSDAVAYHSVVTNNKNILTTAVGRGTSTLTLLTQGTVLNFTQKEFINAVITYKIRK